MSIVWDDLGGLVGSGLGDLPGAERITDRRGSEVWRVEDPRGVIAVKVDAGLMAAREAAVLREVAQTDAAPLAGPILAAGALDDGRTWMAVPWETGPHLGVMFRAVRKDPADLAARKTARTAAVRAARALAVLHSAGWAHGDVQFSHVLYSRAGVRLLDLAWAHGGALPAEFDGVVYRGALVHLEAPEIADAILESKPVTPTPAADVYALAGALWAALTQTWPVRYEEEDEHPWMRDVSVRRVLISDPCNERVPPGLWPEFEAVLCDALSFRPENRPTAADFADMLAATAPGQD